MKIKGLKESFGLAGASIGMGVLGEAFNSEGLKQGGEATGKFIPVTVNLGMGLTTIDMLKELQKKIKK